MSKKIAPKYVFGYFTVEDIEQEAFILGMEGFKSYDGERSLYNFLYTHIKNRLGNIKRKHYERIHPPCDKCPFDAYIKKTGKCKKYEIMEDCSLYYNWIKRNIDKKGIMCPADINIVENSASVKNDGDQEVKDLIESKLSIAARKIWLKLKYGDKLSKSEKIALEKEIREIINVQ